VAGGLGRELPSVRHWIGDPGVAFVLAAPAESRGPDAPDPSPARREPCPSVVPARMAGRYLPRAGRDPGERDQAPRLVGLVDCDRGVCRRVDGEVGRVVGEIDVPPVGFSGERAGAAEALRRGGPQASRGRVDAVGGNVAARLEEVQEARRAGSRAVTASAGSRATTATTAEENGGAEAEHGPSAPARARP